MAERIPCQVCRRELVPLRDGTSRRHRAPRSYEPWSACQGSGYRLARWEVGQRLLHHTGSVWVVEEDRDATTKWGDYIVRCIDVSRAVNDNEDGRVMVAHGEYLHRHGWEPLPAETAQRSESADA